jgi:hypothetical protein
VLKPFRAVVFKKVTFLYLIVFLIGCDKTPSSLEICDTNPRFCADLNYDRHCDEARSELIKRRYAEANTPDDKHKFELLTSFHTYAQCIELASSIKDTKSKEKATARVNGHLTALKEINRLSKQTEDSKSPDLLFYHWSFNGNEAAIESLIEMDNKGELEDSKFQYQLATYYAKFDTESAFKKLFYALELNPAGSMPQTDIYISLTNMFYQKNDYKSAYTWALIAQQSGITNIELAPLEYQLNARKQSITNLKTKAIKMRKSIEQGKFISPYS